MNPLLASLSLPGRQAGQAIHSLRRAGGVLVGRLSATAATLALWHRRHRDRRQLANLQYHMLRDIGMSFAEVEHEISKPFWRG